MEKVEAKVLQMDQSMHIIRNEFAREKENLGRLEITGLRNNEDFKNVVG